MDINSVSNVHPKNKTCLVFFDCQTKEIAFDVFQSHWNPKNVKQATTSYPLISPQIRAKDLRGYLGVYQSSLKSQSANLPTPATISARNDVFKNTPELHVLLAGTPFGLGDITNVYP